MKINFESKVLKGLLKVANRSAFSIFAAMNTTSYRKIKLKPMKERSVMNFHPWVFSGAIATVVKDYGEGEVVEVLNRTILPGQNARFVSAESNGYSECYP